MSVIVILLLASLAVALVFLAAFVWAVRAGQFDDTATPALRVLADDRTASCSLSLEGEGRGEGEALEPKQLVVSRKLAPSAQEISQGL